MGLVNATPNSAADIVSTKTTATTPTHLCQTDIHETEGPRSSDTGAAVDHTGPHVLPQGAAVPYRIEKVQKHVCRLGNAEVWPASVVEV